MTEFEIIKPDDMHLHLRDGDILKAVAPFTAKQFSRAIVMPNLVPPVINAEMAFKYKNRILEATENFEPLMVLYLTDNTSKDIVRECTVVDHVFGFKLYPSGATTNSDSGVTDVKKVYPIFEEMERLGVRLLIHGEVTHDHIDIFDREKRFIENSLIDIVNNFPDLKIVFEHITTKDAADFVKDSSENIAATITAHHLMFNRNHMLVGGIKPHYYCLPILKADEHRKALVEAALSGNKKFFAGTDSAPHLKGAKEAECGCAGCFTANCAVEMYAEIFDEQDLSKPETQEKFENFMSKNGADFYGLGYNSEKITLKKEPAKIIDKVETTAGDIIPLMAGKELSWSIS